MSEKKLNYVSFESEKTALTLSAIVDLFTKDVETKAAREIPQLLVDLRNVKQSEEDSDVLRKQLKTLGLWGKNLGYSAFPKHLIHKVLRTGTYYDQSNSNKDEMFCCTVQKNEYEKEVIRHDEEKDLLFYLIPNVQKYDSVSTFVVYNLDYMNQEIINGFYTFSFPEYKKAAVEAVVRVLLY